MFEVYVWYRVQHDDRDTETAMRAMMARVACRTGAHARLLRRHDDDRLWMECYAGIDDIAAFTRALDAQATARDVDMFIDGVRHLECFVDQGGVSADCPLT